jgi:endonuclease/exonuclease/phosphatase (EEP) superfamily protein YafD
MGWAQKWVPWVIVGVILAWTAVRVFGLDDHFGLVLLIGQTPLMVGGAVGAAASLVVLRRWPESAVAMACLAVLTILVSPRGVRDSDPLAGATGQPLRLASANLKIGAADPAKLLRRLADDRVEILAVQEMTPDWLRRADAAGLADQFPYRIEVPGDLAEGSTLFSRYPLTETGGAPATDGWYYQMYGTVQLPDGTTVFVQSVHTAAPLSPSGVGRWRDSMSRQPKATPAGELKILIGDFNASLDAGRMRALIDTGYRDAAAVLGKGFFGTFGASQVRPPVVLDHALADRRIGIKDFAAYHLDGSDHQLIVVDVVLPASR